MGYKTDCYLVKKEYVLNKEKIEEAFNLILSMQDKTTADNKNLISEKAKKDRG